MKNPSFFKNFFKDADGNVVIGQFPNAPLVLGGVWFGLRFLAPDSSQILLVSQGALLGCLSLWAYYEIATGVNSWRRLLGLVVAGWIVWTVIGMV